MSTVFSSTPAAAGLKRDAVQQCGAAGRSGWTQGLMAGALFGGVDAVILSATAEGVPYFLPVVVIGLCAVGGGLAGLFLTPLVSLARLDGAAGCPAAAVETSARQALLVTCGAVVATLFAERWISGVGPELGSRLGLASMAVGLVVLGVGMVPAGVRRMAESPERFSAGVFAVALFAGLWQPINLAYEAGFFSLKSAAVNGVLLAGVFGAYRLAAMVATRVAGWVARRSRGDKGGASSVRSGRRVAGALVVGAVGVAASWATIAAGRPSPIDLPFRSVPAVGGSAVGRGSNVVLIVMDTTRADHLSVYGYERNTSPNLAELAEESLVFANALAPSSWTLPSHASLLTGTMPTEHGAHLHPRPAGDAPSQVKGLPRSATTLAEVLLASGYQTGAVIGNTAVLTREMGFDQGFLYFDDLERSELASANPRTLTPSLWLTRFLQQQREPEKCFVVGGWQFRYFWRFADELNRRIFSWLDRREAAPLFLFVNYMDPHDPYRAHPRFLRQVLGGEVFADGGLDDGMGGEGNVPALLRNLPGANDPHWREQVDRYDGEIAFTDHHIGRLIERLKRDGLFEDSLIIVTADHGEAFGEHGAFGHHNSLYQEEIHVPLIVRFPHGRVRGRSEEFVSLADVMPMILDYLNLPCPSSLVASRSMREGRILSEVCLDDGPSDSEDGLTRAVVSGAGVKSTVDAFMRVTQRFDLVGDPLELNNLARADVSDRAGVGAWMARWAADARSHRLDDSDAEMSDSVRQKLSALGYID